MPDIDTSMNRDPKPSAAELEAIRDRMLARLEAGSPVRIIRVISTFVQSPKAWRADARRLSHGYRNGKRPDMAGGEAARTRQAAATAELWGLPVGVVTGVREEQV